MPRPPAFEFPDNLTMIVSITVAFLAVAFASTLVRWAARDGKRDSEDLARHVAEKYPTEGWRP